MARPKGTTKTAKKLNWGALPTSASELITDKFQASPAGGGEKVDLEAQYRKILKFPDLSAATAFFGSIDNLLENAAENVNADSQTSAKNSAKNEKLGFETRVERQFQAYVARFIEKKGEEPTDSQKETMRERVRAKLIELDRLAQEGTSVDDL